MVSELKTRENLLEKATEVFAEKGFSGARVDEIARQAGVNKAMIYYHFDSKEDLYQAVLVSLLSTLRGELDKVVQPDDPARTLGALYPAFAEVFRRHPALPRVMLREVLAGGEHMRPETAQALVGVVGIVRDTIERGAREGILRPVDPLLVHFNQVGTLLLYSISGAFRSRIAAAARPGFELPSQEALLDYLQQVLARTLAPEEPGVPRRRTR